MKMNKAVFVDRDGTINIDKGYTYKTMDLQFFSGAIEGLQLLSQSPFKLIIISNQSGIGRGYYREEDYQTFMKEMLNRLKEENVRIDAAYHCPHTPNEHCECRKPKLGNVKKAQHQFNLDLKKSYIIGDKTEDIQTGINAGMKTIAVQTGNACKDGKFNVTSDFTVKNLYEAATLILKEDQK